MYLSATLIIAALSSFAEANPTLSSGVAIPITKRTQVRSANGVVDVARLQGGIHHTIAKFYRGFQAYQQNTGTRHPSAPQVKRADLERRDSSIGSEPLIDHESEYWYGSVSVGTPAKTFTVVFATGSSDFFLPGSDCTDGSCKGQSLYNPSESSTAQDLKGTFKAEYGNSTNFVNGTLYRDDVTVVGYIVKGQTLGVATHLAGVFDSDDFVPDSLLGLAFQEISAYNATPVIQTLVAQGSLPANTFGVYLAKEGSELFLGGTNDKLHKGDFTFVPLTAGGFWQSKFDAISINGQKIAGVTDLIIDTATTQVLGDYSTVRAIYDQISGSADIGSGLYSIPCSLNNTISFQFGAATFEIEPQTFNLGPLSANSTDCIGGFAALTDDTPFWVLGTVFLQNVYTEFDVGNKQIGFATPA